MAVFQFSDFEQAIEFMQRQTEEANALLADEQRALTWGSRWLRFDTFMTSQLLIGGRVFTEAEIDAAERESYGSADDSFSELPPWAENGYASLDAAVADVVNHYRENHNRGYLFGKAYSSYEPTGELGDTHRANAWPCPDELWNALVDANWEPQRLRYAPFEPGIYRLFAQAFRGWMTAELAKAGRVAQTEQSESKNVGVKQDVQPPCER